MREKIFTEIAFERSKQDLQWGGPSHDDSHSLLDWPDFIEKQTNAARESLFDITKFETRMIKIAALAVASIESSRRRRGIK